ncbi:MAG: multidrug ABC transporter ATP-binding protein, partial [Chloroflexia bacterium]|nr:multidrug ABC transporter ATP-binding protein [Chloroflexia bacterium]
MLKQFFVYYKPWKKLFYVDFGSAVVSGLLELAFPLAVAWFIDDLLPSGNWNRIIAASVGLFLIYVLNTGLMVIVTYWGHMLGINIETELR